MQTAADLVKALPLVLQAVPQRRLSAREEKALARMIDDQRLTLEAEQFDIMLRPP